MQLSVTTELYVVYFIFETLGILVERKPAP